MTIANRLTAIGVTFLLRPDTLIYASYMTGLQETGLAPTTAVNAFQTLLPTTAKQKEIGIRSTALYGLSTTLAYFDINRGTEQLNEQNVFWSTAARSTRGLRRRLAVKSTGGGHSTSLVSICMQALRVRRIRRCRAPNPRTRPTSR
ncbi:TonB-dependent receptor domain-containing protein [Paraburkholderia sp. ZP32-5]|uniref:TonB-dependent receptor domain-containing protein n=1 Tax=Paraburkholderia sp. ZP32-5 TaxID=2883245 RepID=UPI002DD43398|nr:TonB-dependent receptor [Paraburkholderia sp. ZP32-5]